MGDSTSRRGNYVPWHKMVELDRFGGYVRDAFRESLGVYQVGSSLKRLDYRDVDVRLMFTDEDFDRRFGRLASPRYKNACWNAHCIAWTHFGQSITGLLIDFQIDRQTEANDLYPSSAGHLRSALGHGVKGPA